VHLPQQRRRRIRDRNALIYRSDLSNVGPAISAGTTLYAHVDSANRDTAYGAVLENHERDGRPYNNIRATTAASTISPPAALTDGPPDAALPPRQDSARNR
jgi:hypothetical protein